jgi:hypothetical protein
VAFLVSQVPGQLGGEGIHGVAQPVMAVAVVGEAGAHPRPQVGVLAAVVGVHLGFEHFPASQQRRTLPGVIGAVAARGPGQVGQIRRSSGGRFVSPDRDHAWRPGGRVPSSPW